MKNVWKWIIGIVLGLLTFALLVVAGFMFRTGSLGCGLQAWGGFGRDGIGMMPYGGMHSRIGMAPFGGLLGALIPLGILTLIVLGIVWLVRSLRHPVAPSLPVAPPAPVMHCKNCGQTVENTWRNCPHCGRKL